MKISKRGNNLIVEIPLFQRKHNPYDKKEKKELTANVVGVIAGNMEQGIYQLDDLSYKGSVQLGMPLVLTYMKNDEFRKMCKRVGIACWEYETCSQCGATLWGAHTYGERGPLCLGHEKKEEGAPKRKRGLINAFIETFARYWAKL